MQTISYQQIKDIQSHDGATIINVLPSKYFEQTHIPGSINIPHENADFVQQVETVLGDKTEPVIVYCASTECDASEKAAEKLDKAGFQNVMDYAGGAKEWQQKSKADKSTA